MIKWITTYLLLLPLTTFSQVDISNSSLKYPQINILYIGVENIIKVSGVDKDSNLKLISSKGEVRKSIWYDSLNTFLVRVHYTGTDTLRLYQDQNLLLTRIYAVEKVNPIIAQLGDILDTTATKQEILKAPILNVVIPNCYLDHQFQIISFQISFLKAYGDTIKTLYTTNGNHLIKKQINLIKKLMPGNKIAFAYITATCPSCQNIRLKPITITIK